MGFPHTVYPDDLRDAIGQALLKGRTAPSVCRDLAAGTFQGFDPCQMPLSTARYYGAQARKRDAAGQLTPRAKGDITQAVEAMAREILSELDQELRKTRRAKTRDLEKLGAIAKLLKECKALAPTPGPAKGAAGNGKPSDPFAAALAKRNTATTRADTPPSQ